MIEPARGTWLSGQDVFPVSNEDYRGIASELEGLEAIQSYQKDAHGGKFWQDTMNLKKQLAELVTHELAEHVKQGHSGTGARRTMQ
jgi:hypothetical protein